MMKSSQVLLSFIGLLLITSQGLLVEARIPSIEPENSTEDAAAAAAAAAVVTTPRQHKVKEQPKPASSQRDLQDCAGVYPDPSKIKLLLTEDFMINKVDVMKNLTTIVTTERAGPIEDIIEEQRKIYERFDGFSDGCNDQALVAKTFQGICFSTYQSTANNLDDGTVAAYLQYALDQWQNLDPFTTRIGDCTVRNGFIRSYNSSYGDELRKSVNDCVASCEGGCPLVLGGESSGGAAAVVAAIDLAHLDPEVITFAAPKAVSKHSTCSGLNEKNHYRFINTKDGFYDTVPMQINVSNERHIGWQILMDDLNYPLLTTGIEDSLTRTPFALELHEWDLYLERINGMVNGNCFPIPVSKWPDDHYCNYDDECDSLWCKEKLCVRGLGAEDEIEDDEAGGATEGVESTQDP